MAEILDVDPDTKLYDAAREAAKQGKRMELQLVDGEVKFVLVPKDGETATAQTSARAVPQNPLINENPRDTLDYCAHVIAYLRAHVPDPEAVHHVEMGRELIFRLVQEALEYESGRGSAP